MKKLILLILLSFAISYNSYSCNFTGAQISITHLSGTNYKVTFSFYRDCSAINAPNSLNLTATCPSNPSLNFNFTVNKEPNTGLEITKPCPSNPTHCNGGNNFGVQEYIYSANIALVPNSEWIISQLNCCRNPVNTIQNAGIHDFYIETKVNTFYTANQLPFFPEVPNMIFIKGELITFNNTAIDLDGDSLSYHLINPRNGVSTDIQYISPYSATNFCSSSIPITLNSSTGQITMKPNSNLYSVMVVRVDEWKKTSSGYVKVSSMMRDLIIQVTQSNNHLPYLSGIDNNWNPSVLPIDSLFEIDFVAGQDNSFSVFGVDSNKFDSLNTGAFNITMDSNFSFIDFTPHFTPHFNGTDSGYAQIQCKPNYSDIRKRPYFISISIEDFGCPYHGEQDFIYKINVVAPPLKIGNDTTICVTQNIQFNVGDSSFNYLWSTGDTTNSIFIQGANLGVGNHVIWVKREGFGTIDYDTINLSVDACLGLNNSSDSSNFKIYPNPNKGSFVVEKQSVVFEDMEIELLDVSSRLLMKKRFLAGENSLQFDVSDLSKGIYYLKITRQDISWVEKIVKE